MLDRAVEGNAPHRPGTPEEVVETMLFLCAGAAFITRQTSDT